MMSGDSVLNLHQNLPFTGKDCGVSTTDSLGYQKKIPIISLSLIPYHDWFDHLLASINQSFTIYLCFVNHVYPQFYFILSSGFEVWFHNMEWPRKMKVLVSIRKLLKKGENNL